ncbi:hypothetical protein C0995_002983 [Termitomyces sp. Mi166|nr:hypothetical protein C0995_002983 [Termitomyces sp. Mi166\
MSLKCDSEWLYRAIRHANTRLYTVTETLDPVLVNGSPYAEHAIDLATPEDDATHCDEMCTAPIHNYARFLSWSQSVEEVACAFEAALDANSEKQESETCMVFDSEYHINETSTIHWGTAGGAMIIDLYTPTYGLGCRTGSYLLYGWVGTLSWILLVISTFLCHYSITTTHSYKTAHIARQLSIALRSIGQVFSFCNAIWIVLSCVFQFSNFYDRCWCNSSVIGLGAKAYNVIEITWDEVPFMRAWWIIGVAIAAGSASIYVFFINLSINPRLPQEIDIDSAAR